MSAVASVKVLAVGATWRLTGIRPAGAALLRAVTEGGEDERTLAGMQLVKAGDRSVPMVTEALLTGQAAPELVDVLASIDSAEARAGLTEVAYSKLPTVLPQSRESARSVLHTLDQLHRPEDE